MTTGIGVSPGIGIGKIKILKEQSLKYENIPIKNTQQEIERFHDALQTFYKTTQNSIDEMTGRVDENEIDIIRGHIVMLKDPIIISEVEDKIHHGMSAEAAFEDVCNVFINVFSSSEDELIQLRAADVKDIKRRILKILLGVEELNFSEIEEGTLLVMSEIVPSIAAQLDTTKIAGIITEKGGLTSHSAILLRSIGIPSVFGANGILSQITSDDFLIVDGINGDIIINPSKPTIQKYTQRRESYIKQYLSLENYRNKPTLTKDGIKKHILCNICHPEDCEAVKKNDGEGIGLFRSEYLFINRKTFPSEKEQYNAYKAAVSCMKGRPTTIRTLDIGGDKEILYAGFKKEENPFLGLRAIRYCLKYMSNFRNQLGALIRASEHGNLKIMIPFITNVEEIRSVKQEMKAIMDEYKERGIPHSENIKLGAMIETPSACAICDLLAKECDFFSIGTNDLVQYTMAVDRGSIDVAYLYSAYNPAVLRFIKHIIETANENKIPVSICGEMASDVLAVPLLISFGLDEFSVSPNHVLEIRKAISMWTKEEADYVTEKAMSYTTSEEIQKYLLTVRK